MENDPLLHRIRNWFGVRSAGAEDSPQEPEGPVIHAEESPQLVASRELLGQVTSFLLQHRIAVDAETLTFAHDLMTGADPRLSGLVNRRLRERQPIDAEWITEVRGGTHGDDAQTLGKLRERLEKSVTDFSQTTSDARTATSDYQSALQIHVEELHEVNKAGEMIHELATVAKAMLERTREIEDQMARSERETRLLQRRLEEAKRSAEIDHLTGLPNRRAFEAMLTQEFIEARRSRDALCVAFCDIDKFKLINDQHGHEAGDRVLKLVAKTLSEISDDRCHVARHGGEEFVVLFRGKTAREAFVSLDATRETLAARKLVNRATDTPFGQVSFSGGLADVFGYSDPRAALKAADEALYLAKDQGRNRIIIANPAAAAEVRAA